MDHSRADIKTSVALRTVGRWEPTGWQRSAGGCLVRMVVFVGLLAGLPARAAEPLEAKNEVVKSQSMFCHAEVVERLRNTVAREPWAAVVVNDVREAAKPWVAMSEADLWRLMFGATISRSWMVWSNGHCPACKKAVPMYNWQMDGLGRPWKTWCPHCNEEFPKNDFAAFYRSGLDERGVFDPSRADRSLLFHAEHPDPADPLHRFGVDDGEGYVEGDHRWRFIGAYLI